MDSMLKSTFKETNQYLHQSFGHHEQLLDDPLPRAPFQTYPHDEREWSTTRCTVTAIQLVQTGFQMLGRHNHKICEHAIMRTCFRKNHKNYSHGAV